MNNKLRDKVRHFEPGSKLHGVPPAIALINTKHARNIGAALRACSCFGIGQLWYSGNRVSMNGKHRLPREERMKGYSDVELIQYDYVFDQFAPGITPVAIELRPGSESLADFEHPQDALYVFGPEDGSLERVTTQHCHKFVTIPTRHCTNLAAAVYIVLYDRMLKRYQAGLENQPVLSEIRGFEKFADEELG
jgi:tRNA(Leu) C34 or U34 (ribose-2'-O)-methylase TrmL